MSRVSAFFPILYFDRGYNLEYNMGATQDELYRRHHNVGTGGGGTPALAERLLLCGMGVLHMPERVLHCPAPAELARPRLSHEAVRMLFADG